MRTSLRTLALLMLAAPALATLAAQAPPPFATFDSAWAAMSRTYFDTALVHGRWRAAHDSLRQSLGAAPTLDAERTALRALLQVPGQSHFALISADAFPAPSRGTGNEGGRGSAGLVPRFAADTLVAWRIEPDGAAAAAGLRPGDVLVAVNDLVVDSLRARLRRAFPDAERQARTLALQLVASQLDGAVGDTVHLDLLRSGGARERVAVVRRPMLGRLSQYGNLPPMTIRATLDYTTVAVRGRELTVPRLGFTGWFPIIIQDLDRFAFSMRTAPAVIIDLRGNPGGVVGMIGGFAGHFSDTAWSLGTMRGRGADLRLMANPRRVTPAGERVGVVSGPVAILVDEMTASASEFFAAGMQSLGRARVFGDITAGQSLPAAMQRLPSGDVLMYPVADHEDAGGRRIEGIGVVPDTRTPLRRTELAGGRDAALEAARQWIAETLAAR